MSFNFGTPNSTTAGGSFSFGNTTPAFGTPQQGVNVSFSTPQQQQQQQQPGLAGFGTNIQMPSFGASPNLQQSTPAFGAAAAPTTFGTTQPPAFGAGSFNANAQPSFGTSPALNFGGATQTPAFGAAAPAFGNTQTTAPAFSAIQTAAPAFGASQQPPAFGATTQAAPAFGSFGATSTAAPSAFGATPTMTATMGLPTFGAQSTTGIATGLAKPISTIQPLSLTAAITTTAAALPTFGQATAAVQPNLGLSGLAAPVTTTTAPVSFNFSATPATGGLNFGAAATSTAPATSTTLQGFGIPATSTTAAAPSLGLFDPYQPIPLIYAQTLTYRQPPAQECVPNAPQPTCAKPAAPAATTIPSLFGATPAASSGTTSLFGTSASLTPATTSLGGTSASQAPPAKMGLGGVDSNAIQPKTVEGGRSESGRVKEQQLPQEIVATVEALKGHIKQQKQFSSEIARTSTFRLFNMSSELQDLNWSLTEVSNRVEANYATIKLLHDDTVTSIRQAEMAQRTHEIQPELQFENNVPLQFFMDLVQKYEVDLIKFRKQVEMTEQHMRSMANPQSFSADDLKNGLKQIHESFVALAGRVHENHQKVEVLKEQYLNLRKHLLKDKTNVFADEKSAQQVVTVANISCGPTPFSATFGINLGVSSSSTPGGSSSSAATPQQQQQQHQNQLQQHNSGIGSSGFGLLGQQPSNSLSFGFGGGAAASSTFAGNTMFSSDGTFNLQKPPIGSKRNKQ